MKLKNNKIIYSPTDLANHLNCRHLTELNKQEVRGEIVPPEIYDDARLEEIRLRGTEFETGYLNSLKSQGLRVAEINDDEIDPVSKTIQAMQEGFDVIYQARLKTDSWSGRADFLIKVEQPSKFGDYAYEVWDTKLASNTKAGTLLQIGLYTQQLAVLQGAVPEFMGVIKPHGKEMFRYHDYDAYIRLVQQRLEKALTTDTDTYPEPVPHCDVCKWWKVCQERRRTDDHLSFVAGMGRRQADELRNQGVNTLAELAKISEQLTFTPTKGSTLTYEKLSAQARLQYLSRENEDQPMHEFLELEPQRGLFLLPEPSKHDVYLDFEGARFVEPDGLEYLIGYYYQGEYKALWALDEEQERLNFEQLIDFIHQVKKENPEAYVYHYSPYEPSAIKRLTGKYASRAVEVDFLLRSKSFIDLYRVVRQSLIASVERYSLKDLEKFFSYEREMDLRKVSRPKIRFEILLEQKQVTEADESDKKIIEEYNADDCKALPGLQRWLEELRMQLIAQGQDIPRPPLTDGQASDSVNTQQEENAHLFQKLMDRVPVQLSEHTPIDRAYYILAHLLDYYRREDRVVWWDYFRLRELEPDELLDERKAISYLTLNRSYQEKRSTVDVYSFPPQELDLKIGSKVENREGKKVGTLKAVDRDNRSLEIKYGNNTPRVLPIGGIIQLQRVEPDKKVDSIKRLATWVAEHEMNSEGKDFRVARKLLQRKGPNLPPRNNGQSVVDYALTVLENLDGDYLAIQGPPGAGKSHTAGNLILGLIKKNKKVGITAMSHKVITNLLNKVQQLADQDGTTIQMIQKPQSDYDDAGLPWNICKSKQSILEMLPDSHVIAGTSFMWADEDLASSVDYLFVDEAGQLALVDTLALAQATNNLVLLGDPNQLQQPQQGVHPAGTEVSALEHVLDGNITIAEDQGIFLSTTWRMHPGINELVSKLFYQGRLTTEAHTARQEFTGNIPYQAGLLLMECHHSGNTSSSQEEVNLISDLVRQLTSGQLMYDDGNGSKPVTSNDIKIISPYNAQVNLLRDALPGIEIGTVDKFQGQEAPIIIYSVASSSTADAPRGMSFLYSPNRLNVAISRAKALFIMVASPSIFEAECNSPEEMKLANAFCRFREVASTL